MPSPDQQQGWAPEVLAKMGYAVFEPADGGARTLGGASWAEAAEFPEASDFLAYYMQEVREADTVHSVKPAVWQESGLSLEAVALESEGRRLVAVRHLNGEFERRRLPVQRANEEALARRRLLREVQKKEMLLRCIVHDLGNPLATVIMNLQRALRIVDQESAQWSLQTALEQAVRQRSMIRSVIDVFGAEMASLDRFQFDPSTAPELLEITQAIVDGHRDLAEAANVRISIRTAGPDSLPVRAETALLERVIENLLANAVRHGGQGGEVTLEISTEGGEVILAVNDRGPGMPPGFENTVFEPFTQGAAPAGESGLGLYFCKRSVERWGGSIGCENRESGGARFWFRLRRV